MWRRSLHDKFGLFENKYTVSDALAWHQWHKNGVKFLNIDEILAIYYQGGPSHNLETRIDQETGRPLRDIDLDNVVY